MILTPTPDDRAVAARLRELADDPDTVRRLAPLVSQPQAAIHGIRALAHMLDPDPADNFEELA